MAFHNFNCGRSTSTPFASSRPKARRQRSNSCITVATLQIVYGKWTYTGPLLVRKITGTCLAVLKTGYTKDSDGKYYITSRMDGFLSVDSGGAELLARTLQPLVVKNVDSNFIQTVAFLGSMSKTAEVNLGGMQRLAGRLAHVQPETRQQLSTVVASVAQREAANAAANAAAQKDHRCGAWPPILGTKRRGNSPGVT